MSSSELHFTSDHLPSDIRRFHIKRKQSPIGTFDYVAGVLCSLTIIIRSLLMDPFSLSDLCMLFCIVLVLARCFYLSNTITEESLLVVHDLGVQITRKSFSGKETHLFIDKDKITSIVINEGITMFRVIFYMGFIVEGQDDMILAFNLLPRMEILLPVYQGTRTAFYGETDIDKVGND